MASSIFRITLLASVSLILFPVHVCAKKTLSIYIQRLDAEIFFLIQAKKHYDHLKFFEPQIDQLIFRQTSAVLKERNRLLLSIRSGGLGTVGNAFMVSPIVIMGLLIGRESEAAYKKRRWSEILDIDLEDGDRDVFQGLWGYEDDVEQELSKLLGVTVPTLGDRRTVVGDAERPKKIDDGLDIGAENRDDTSWRMSNGRMRPGETYNLLTYKCMVQKWCGDKDVFRLKE
ncbi:MAG: hypothetical protein HETSPECPRED_008706 [Heterodermia speciosa]|uniref:Uncharacterized protein n=1 Tax=Heterodermia speciosa TaxID=116794 RepID=A0A8H3G5X0_9LECA|nr:MAG: hypothetical protein HETSPECPRED_008706 [Heterodermia speciosa]